MKYAGTLLTLVLTLALLCTGCANDLIYIVTDGVYTMDTAKEKQEYVPHISFDTKDQTFTFSYDMLSSYLNYGSYEIEKDEVIATTSDEKYIYRFEIVDDNMVSFIAETSHSTETVEGIVAVPDHAVFVLGADK